MKNRKIVSLLVCTLSATSVLPGNAQKALRESLRDPEQPTVKQMESTIKQSESRKAYSTESKIQSTPVQIGPSKPERLPPVSNGAPPPGTENPNDQIIQMDRPKLQALISVNRDVSPFSLDSDFQNSVRLRDVLLTVSGANLDILRSVANEENAKWLWRSSISEFLPNVTLGFNQLGINSTTAIPIRSTAIPIIPGQALGSPVDALATKTIVKTPITALQSGFNWSPIQGGRLIFSAINKHHTLRAQRAQLRTDISDTLLSATNDYYDLVYNEALLQIRTAAMKISEEQVRQNISLEDSGLATNLDVLQAKTQLSKDMQNLVNQQARRRSAAIKLAHDMNLNLGQDLLPGENTLKRNRLIAADVTINQLLKVAIDNRPELKRFEQLRLAAKQNIGVAASDALPTVSLSGSIAGIQSRIDQMYPTYMLNFGVSWKFDGLGTKVLAETQAARWRARTAMLEANQEFLTVMDQVRNAYNNTLTTEIVIDQSTNEVLSAQEELRLARMRLDNGLGTNIDVLTAQRDLTEARLDKALALINFNKAQAQLLHDIGLVSIDNLSAGLQLMPKAQ